MKFISFWKIGIFHWTFNIQGILIVCIVGGVECYEIVECVVLILQIFTLNGFSSIISTIKSKETYSNYVWMVKCYLFFFKYLFLGKMVIKLLCKTFRINGIIVATLGTLQNSCKVFMVIDMLCSHLCSGSRKGNHVFTSMYTITNCGKYYQYYYRENERKRFDALLKLQYLYLNIQWFVIIYSNVSPRNIFYSCSFTKLKLNKSNKSNSFSIERYKNKNF